MHSEAEIFCAVAQAQGFSSAARRLGIGKSAVSKAVQKLEKRLGVRLLHRTTRRISLSEAGEAYYGHARLALQQMQAAADAVASLAKDPQGRLRLSAPMSLGLAKISSLVGEFLVAYPGMEVDLNLDDRRVDLIAGGFDLAIRVGVLPDSSMVAQPIGTMPAVAVAAPSYLAVHGEPTTPADLIEHDCLLYSYHAEPGQWLFRDTAGEARVRVRGRLQVNSSIALRQAALLGLGVCRLPEYLVREDIAAGRLRRVLPAYQMDSAVIHAVFPEQSFIPRKVRLLVEFFRDRFDG